ncbi:MAG: DUF2789 family protein [Pseudomonas sp.]|uniref:DUF2789 family protein n=1 Tax=Pseudomonas abieticivorans TaxID=2931382 RepID=UPI0020C0D6A4|nr:DUF2789 family protein [Pseudomonas sp. PIA16]MDE1168269.1 DUF2789 family protein [Pseudomonas sp.]
MQLQANTLPALFEQLGLDSDMTSIEKFVTTHSPLKKDEYLHQAEFWSEGQRAFLKEGIKQDSDWAVAIDELNLMLHKVR